MIRAAVRMFNERGFYSRTFEDVAATLGVSKATIYHYLGNKEEVLLECMSRGYNELRKAAKDASASPGNGADRLRTFLIRYVQLNMDDFGRCAIRTPEEGLSVDCGTRFRTWKRDVDESLRELVRAAIADGSIPQTDVALLTRTVVGALNWPARWYQPTTDAKAAIVAQKIVDILFNGLQPGAPN